MAAYKIGNQTFGYDHTDFAGILADAHRGRKRPLCLCRPAGVEMYIAKVNGKHVLKRMPNTGSNHSPACESYDPPPELSGLGEVMGSAIAENLETGTIALKLGFSLSKVPGRAPPAPGDGESDSVKTDGNKLTIRGMLHYLWEQAGFNRWSPSMSGKRNWHVIRKYLLQAAADKSTKGADLSDILYIPEFFRIEDQAAITQRRIGRMTKAAPAAKGARQLMVVIGEVKEISPSRYGHKIVLRHVPDCHFMMNDDMHKRLLKRFDSELSLWDGVEGSHLVAIATFGVSASGIASLEEAALMSVNANWIPFDSLYEKMILDVLTNDGRRFMKGLRYNLPATRPLACAVCLDTEPKPTALYVLPPGAAEDYVSAFHSLAQESQLAAWIWSAGSGDMPPLPPVQAAA